MDGYSEQRVSAAGSHPGSRGGIFGVVEHLGALRDQGLVKYRNEDVTMTESGIFLGVGPVQLTPAGKDALEHDQRLGPRPSRFGGLLPWRS